MQDSGGGGRKPKEGKGVAPSKRRAPRWCPRGITKTQKHILQRMRQRELAEKKEEEERDYWFNMVFMILAEFCALVEDNVELMLGAGGAMFEKLKNLGAHMKPLFIWGHLDGTPIGHMLVDGGPSINILPMSLFEKLGHVEGDLSCTNLSLSGFAGDPTEAKGIIFKEVTVGSKTVPTAFFMVKGRYNMLLGQDWIHADECVPSTIHQCVIQWVGDEVEVVQADEDVCVAVAESQVDI
jgi:hypothetical protein